MGAKLQQIKQLFIPLGTKRRVYYDKFWYGLNIIKSWGLSKFLSELRKFLLNELNINLVFRKKEVRRAIKKSTDGKGEREEYFKMLFEQTKKKSNEYIEYKEHHFGEKTIKVIAFYLPQFHPIPENDLFWGKGFTDWVNVARAVPQFMGHYQPHIPGELGFYDLRLVDTLTRQVELAKNYGIYAFCFHHYWFNGKRVMRTPIDLFLEHKEIDFKFCINWANENWTRAWDGLTQEILLKQKHSPEDDIAFIEDTARYFSDPRYVRIYGKPLLVIYRPALLPDPEATAERWRNWCRNKGIGEIYLVSTHSFDYINPETIGFDATIDYPPNTFPMEDITYSVDFVNSNFEGSVFSYDSLIRLSKNYTEPPYTKFRGICPRWDNDPRRPGRSIILYGSNAQKYQNWLEYILAYTYKHFKNEEKFVFINAWNEWAEGNHLEPDRKFGYAYLEATSSALENFTKRLIGNKIIAVSHDAHPHGAQFLILNIIQTLKEQFGFEVVTILKGDGILNAEFSKYSKVIEWFKLNNQEKSLAVKRIFNRGFRKAICNTSAVGEIVEQLKSNGFEVITLIHEMAEIIKEKHFEDSIGKIILHSDLLIFPGKQVLESFTKIAQPAPQKIVIRSQGLYQKNAYKNRITEARAEIRKSYNLPENSVIVLNVGFADYRKGFDLFVEIGEKLLDQNSNVYCIWVGNQEKAIFEGIIGKIDKEKLNQFIFPGFVKNLPIFYAASDIFLLSSREDPFPSVVLEALDIGLPVLGFEGAGSFGELLEGKGGILVPYLDTSAAANEIIELLKNRSKWEKISQVAKEIIQERFDFLDYIHDLLSYLHIYAPKISAIIPNYNYEMYIGSRMDSILNQTYKPYEIIFLDDCSQDNSVDIASAKLSKSNIKYKMIKNSQNQGCFRQWLKGLREAKGDIVWFAETDDSSERSFLREMMNFFEDEQVVLAYCQSKVLDENSKVLDFDYKQWTNDISEEKWKISYCNEGKIEVAEALIIKNTIPNANAVLIRKSTLSGIDEYLERFKTSGDWFTYIYALKKGKICFSSKKLNYHRRHSKSIIAVTAATYGHFDDHLEIINFLVENFQLTVNQVTKSLEYLDKQYDNLLSDRTGYKTISDDPRYSETIKRIKEKNTD